jgi:hypothetical protein
MLLGAVAGFWSRLNYIDELTHGRDLAGWLESELETWQLLSI